MNWFKYAVQIICTGFEKSYDNRIKIFQETKTTHAKHHLLILFSQNLTM